MREWGAPDKLPQWLSGGPVGGTPTPVKLLTIKWECQSLFQIWDWLLNIFYTLLSILWSLKVIFCTFDFLMSQSKYFRTEHRVLEKNVCSIYLFVLCCVLLPLFLLNSLKRIFLGTIFGSCKVNFRILWKIPLAQGILKWVREIWKFHQNIPTQKE